MDLIDRLFDIARRRDRKIVLPEGEDARIVAAAAAQKRGDRTANSAGHPVPSPRSQPIGVSLDGIEIVDLRSDTKLHSYGAALAACATAMTQATATRLVAKPLYFGGMMVRQGDAAAMVAGAASPTRRVIEAGLMTVGLAARHRIAVELFSHCRAGFSKTGTAALYLCRLRCQCRSQPGELADIAMASARSARALLGEEPRVAMLSFSTKGSAQHARVDKVRRALALVRAARAGAFHRRRIPSRRRARSGYCAQESERGQRRSGPRQCADFPDLDSGNIGYKLTQWLGGAQAIGPILQGFAKPISDLSRGASDDDIVTTCAIVLAQR